MVAESRLGHEVQTSYQNYLLTVQNDSDLAFQHSSIPSIKLIRSNPKNYKKRIHTSRYYPILLYN